MMLRNILFIDKHSFENDGVEIFPEHREVGKKFDNVIYNKLEDKLHAVDF